MFIYFLCLALVDLAKALTAPWGLCISRSVSASSSVASAHTATETSCAVIARPPRPAAAARAGEAWEKVAKAHRRLVKIRPVNSSAAPGSDCCSHGKREKVTARKMMDNQTIINYVSPAGSNMIC